jgi:hypothetical protein
MRAVRYYVTNINAVRFADHSLVARTSLGTVSIKEVMAVVSMSQHNHVTTNYLQCDFIFMIAPKYVTERAMYCGFCYLRLTVFTTEITIFFYSLQKSCTAFNSNL